MACSQPCSMNSAVIRPQAMNAPILGMTMFDSAVPNFCTRTRTPVRGDASCRQLVLDIRVLRFWPRPPTG